MADSGLAPRPAATTTLGPADPAGAGDRPPDRGRRRPAAIAEELESRWATVRSHIRSILAKLGVGSPAPRRRPRNTPAPDRENEVVVIIRPC
jgi:hypothetical protein